MHFIHFGETFCAFVENGMTEYYTIQPNMKVYRYGEIGDIHVSMFEQKSLLKHVLFGTGEFDEKSLLGT